MLCISILSAIAVESKKEEERIFWREIDLRSVIAKEETVELTSSPRDSAAATPEATPNVSDSKRCHT